MLQWDNLLILVRQTLMKKNLHRSTFLLIIGLSVVNGVSVIAHSLLATIVGVSIALIEIQFLNAYEVRWKVLNLTGATFANTVVTYIILYFYCALFTNSLCERNLFLLSILPGFILTIDWLAVLIVSLLKR